MKLFTVATALALGANGQECSFQSDLPMKDDDFGQPDWAAIIETAFPVWDVPEAGCPRLDKIGGSLEVGFETYPTPVEGKFNPCYYTKAFDGLDPMLGGYPTPIDTKHIYEFASPFFGQPGDGTSHHCAIDAPPETRIQSCPEVAPSCGEGIHDCNTITDEFGIGRVLPIIPLVVVKNAFLSCQEDVCAWFDDDDLYKCSFKKSVLDRLILETFGTPDGQVKFNNIPDWEFDNLGDPVACAGDNCRGPHYCSKDAAVEVGWVDFCPYIQTGENSGKYKHPHIALASLELWMANKCKPAKCPSTWLDSPNGQGYGADKMTSTSIIWAEMDDNSDPMAQPSVPYLWPNSGDGIFPGKDELYGGLMIKPTTGSYVTRFVCAGSTSPSGGSRMTMASAGIAMLVAALLLVVVIKTITVPKRGYTAI